jgi:hypothetical protein
MGGREEGEKRKREEKEKREEQEEKRKKEKELWVHNRQLCNQQKKLMWNFKVTSIPFEITNFKNNAIHISIHTQNIVDLLQIVHDFKLKNVEEKHFILLKMSNIRHTFVTIFLNTKWIS